MDNNNSVTKQPSRRHTSSKSFSSKGEKVFQAKAPMDKSAMTGEYEAVNEPASSSLLFIADMNGACERRGMALL
jgi:hypothetical protein